jgi:hypothetical protein
MWREKLVNIRSLMMTGCKQWEEEEREKEGKKEKSEEMGW